MRAAVIVPALVVAAILLSNAGDTSHRGTKKVKEIQLALGVTKTAQIQDLGDSLMIESVELGENPGENRVVFGLDRTAQGTILTVRNGTTQWLLYDCAIRTDKRFAPTTIAPCYPGVPCLEVWADPVREVKLTKLRFHRPRND